MLTSSAASVAREKGRAHLKNNVFLSVISDEQNTREISWCIVLCLC